jgi:hypothetical protein
MCEYHFVSTFEIKIVTPIVHLISDLSKLTFNIILSTSFVISHLCFNVSLTFFSIHGIMLVSYENENYGIIFIPLITYKIKLIINCQISQGYTMC